MVAKKLKNIEEALKKFSQGWRKNIRKNKKQNEAKTALMISTWNLEGKNRT